MVRYGQLFIGTSGYQYDHWKDVYYPHSLPRRRWFEHYATDFSSVEINNTFYRLPDVSTFYRWRERAPKGFCYALKFSRYGTHVKRLREAHEVVANFVARAAQLGVHLGPILVQLPPKWHVNKQRLANFLAALPGENRWVIEFRDTSWLCDEIYALLAQYHVALCWHDMIEDHPQQITTKWTYFRFHGDHYHGSYSPQFLSAQARKIRRYQNGGLDVYAYFNNDEHGYAVKNALDLKRYLGD